MIIETSKMLLVLESVISIFKKYNFELEQPVLIIDCHLKHTLSKILKTFKIDKKQ